MTKKILVLGNSPHINQIEFNRLDPTITTIGVNRIWLKHYPDYFFFNDYPIVKELERPDNKVHLAKLTQRSTCYSSSWIRHSSPRIPKWTRVHNVSYKNFFPGSVSNSMLLYRDAYLKDNLENCKFYIAGVNLKFNPKKSHFWKSDDYQSLNNLGESWYLKRFDLMFNNFKRLKNLGFNIVSCTPDSRLNKIFRYQNVSNLYSK